MGYHEDKSTTYMRVIVVVDISKTMLLDIVGLGPIRRVSASDRSQQFSGSEYSTYIPYV
jgi:hypothetical protein